MCSSVQPTSTTPAPIDGRPTIN